MSTLDLISGAEPFLIRGGAVGCLLLHGFTATPNEVRALGEHLGEQGYSVLGPRLAHHGSRPADMRRSRWHDWYLSALDGWHLLSQQCRQVVVIGMSVGGVAALVMASRQPVAAVVTMATPLTMPPDPRLRILRLYARIRPYLPKPSWDKSQRATRYAVTPTLALHELKGYLAVLEEALPQVTAPVLLIHSRADQTVAPDNMDRIYEGLGSAHKERVWLEDAQHRLTEDPQHKDEVFERVVHFVGRWTGPN